MPPGDRPSLADPATELGAEAFLPAQRTLPALRAAAAGCRGCSLWEKATQTVFGAGPVPAALMLVGEQPGDREDIVGDPFVGPAGRVLDQALAEAGIDRERIFVTNVVKHFKWRPSGKRRLHERPSRAEVRACRPWLEAELGLVQPDVMVLLGATAAQAVIGPDFRVTTSRGRVMPSRSVQGNPTSARKVRLTRSTSSGDRVRFPTCSTGTYLRPMPPLPLLTARFWRLVDSSGSSLPS